jgi:hypothetical protein
MMNRVILATTAILGIASIAIVVNLRPYQNEFLAGSSCGVFVVCLLPWLAFVRSKLFTMRGVTSQGWDKAITALLLVAMLAGPLVTASYYLWLRVAKPTDDWGGFGPAIGLFAIAWLSHSVGFGVCIIAFLIQLWRDQWKKVLNVLAITYQLLMYLFLCKING